jgi:REP element-mobilizing transposase RayT
MAAHQHSPTSGDAKLRKGRLMGILAAHVIFSAYGFWLPNDPRGSWSDFVRNLEIFRYGSATKTTARHSLAHDEHDREVRRQAKYALKYPPVQFSGVQARSVATGFSRAVHESGYRAYAFAIMPNHVHGVVGAEKDRRFEQIVGHLKGRATTQLVRDGLHPFAGAEKEKTPSVWSHGVGWKVFLNSDEDILRAIDYVQKNPTKEGYKAQQWKFARDYVNGVK